MSWLLKFYVFVFEFAVEWEGCIYFISSSSTYFWSGDWRVVYFSWCLNRILAGGKAAHVFFSSHWISVECNDWSFVSISGCQIIGWRHWGAKTYYFLCCSSCIRQNIFRCLFFFYIWVGYLAPNLHLSEDDNQTLTSKPEQCSCLPHIHDLTSLRSTIQQ